MSIFRKSYTLPIPAGAELVTVKGVPSARFKRKGKTITTPLTVAGDRVRVLSPFYYGTVNGKPVRLFKDAVASQQRLAELIRKNERQESGVADPFEEHRKRDLCEHLDDYRRFLEAEGNSVKYVAQATSNITAILVGCGFRRIGEMTAEKVAEFLHGLRRDPPRVVLPVGKVEFTPAELAMALGGVRPAKLARVIAREKLDAGKGNGPRRIYPRATVERLQEIFCRGVSVCTSNSYLTAIKSFSRWLLEKERTDRDRLISLSRLNAKTDRRHHRRALDEAELNRLLVSASASTFSLESLTGRDRSMVYMLAMSTGVRASELASLTPGTFAIESDCPTVSVRAAYTKNRLEAEQPLPADVAAAFREYLRDRPHATALWPGQWNKRAAEMLRADLDGACIGNRDADGNVADFHALRASYISLLVRQGANPKVAQTLARHSDPRLTFAVYAKAHIHDLAAAVEGLPINLPDCNRAERASLQATGTDGKPAVANFAKARSKKRLPFPCRIDNEKCGSMREHADDEVVEHGDG